MGAAGELLFPQGVVRSLRLPVLLAPTFLYRKTKKGSALCHSMAQTGAQPPCGPSSLASVLAGHGEGVPAPSETPGQWGLPLGPCSRRTLGSPSPGMHTKDLSLQPWARQLTGTSPKGSVPFPAGVFYFVIKYMFLKRQPWVQKVTPGLLSALPGRCPLLGLLKWVEGPKSGRWAPNPHTNCP